MSIIKEFKDFAMRGNVLDMAVGIIIGGAFGKIVSSVVSDIIMPPIGWLIDGVKFTDLAFSLPGDSGVTINYGNFIQVTFDFIIVAFAIFLLIKGINSLKREKPVVEETPAPPAISKEEELLTEIRDLLKKQ
jgi:large conductance mechanosensitive channel